MISRGVGLILLVLALVLQSGLSTPTRVSIIRPAYFVREYEYIRWQVQIEPHAENRLLVVAAVDGDVVRQTKEQLDGDAAPRTRWIEWKHGIPAGEYQVIAVLYSQANEIARATVPLTVLSRY